LNELSTIHTEQKLKILDYGCGQGVLVRNLREYGYDAYGVDIEGFWEEKFELFTDQELFKQGIISLISQDGTTDLNPHSFDVVVCNMVVEHVIDTEQLFKSVQYLLKNTGRAYFLFPVKEAVREGHIGQYFIHWLPKGKLRYTIALIQRRLGISRKEHPDMSAREYVKMKLDGIDENTHYKSYAAIRRQMSNIFTLHELEADYFLQRLGDKGLGFLSPFFRQPALRKLTNAFFRIYSFAVIKADHLPTF
jgi:2-polyprenyl-3-methyl-5-hydroxy-6-metoxy-1,4-benzoquinol methylase